MSFVKHRHDMMHRGEVPSDQLAGGTPDPGDAPIYQYDGSVEWDSPGSASHPNLATHDALGLATDAELAAHTGDTSDAHDASAISVEDTGGNFTGTDVEAVLAELAAAPGADWRDPTTLSVDLSASGATSIDRDTAATHYLALAGNLTLTPTDSNPPGAGHDIDMRAQILGDGSSTLAFGGTISWNTSDGNPPAAPANGVLLTIGLHSGDDATTWEGYVGAAGSSVGALDDLSDVDAASPDEGDLLRYNGTAWVDITLRPEPMIDSAGDVMTDGALNPMMHEVAW